MKNLFLLFCLVGASRLQSQIVINEIATSNLNVYDDEDSDFPDWIELYNYGVTDFDLTGYSITDNSSQWDQWQFGETIVPAGGRIVVYASGKNRNCLTCPDSPVDHWETAIFDDDIWEYKNGNSEPPSDWNDVTFTGVWSTGKGGFGKGDGDDSTIIGGFSNSFYYRKEFEVADKSKILETIISMDYDDAYVIYINNVEVARINLTGPVTHSTYANYWHEALMYLGYNPKEIKLDSALVQSLLVDGTNVLAVQVHQYGTDDATGRTWLHFGMSTPDFYYYAPPEWFYHPGTAPQLHTNFKLSNGETVYLYNPSGILIDSIQSGDLQVNHVRARIPDAGSWCYSDEPTPMNANAVECYSGYASAPVIITAPGYYDGSVDVEIAGTEIYYTTDGSKPTIAADLYTASVDFSSTGVIKAIQVEAGKLPSRVSSGSYFIDEPTKLPVVSIIADPCDLFDEDDDCPAAYDLAEGWFNHNPKVSVTVEYYDTAWVKQFSNDYKFECVGNFSISLAQKSMRFVVDEDYGSTSEISYNIFEHDKPELSLIHGFRVRNMDQDYYGTRMKDITINRVGMPTRCISTAYQNCVVFINGEYWGMYGAREEMDEYFLRDNFGVNPEEVDLMKTGWGGEEKTMAEAGSDTAFYNLVDFITNNDMSIPSNYAVAVEEVDVENWTDYFATNIFTDNEEWLYILENNLRVFRSYAPDIKWRYMLWDCTNSQFSSNANTLQLSLNNPYNSVYANMFNAMLDNEVFHNYFINRFADLMNYYWTDEFTVGLIDELKEEMGDEIPAQNAEWGTGSFATWNNYVDDLYDFYDGRIGNQRTHIENYFDLNDQVDITINVDPPGAGYVKISTIVPQELPWTGVYFDGVPVTISAIPNPGYEFVDWDDNAFIDDPLQISFTNNMTDNTSFTANFTGSPIANPVVISEINFNSDSTRNAGDWIELHNTADVSVNVSDYTFSNQYFYSDYKIPANTVIPANGYLVLVEDLADFSGQHPDVLNAVGDFHFSLLNDGDSVVLKDFLGEILSTFIYGDERPWPFTADGYGRTMELTADIADPALPSSWFEGCIAGSPGAPFELCLENPLVDEINYKSAAIADAGDWFELYNYGAVDADLSNWTLKDKNGNTFEIPAGTVIASDNYFVFYQDEIKFTEQFPAVTNKTGPLNFGFDGEGDVILIYDDNNILFQSVGFDDEAPYPLSPDGGGTALQILSATANLNDPLNWTESCPEGSPGAAYTLPCGNSVSEMIPDGEILIYPNPASEFLTVQMPDGINGIFEVAIYNTTGIQLMSRPMQINSGALLNISELPVGLYHLQIFSDEQTYQSSFVKH